MSLQHGREQTGVMDEESRNEQERLLNSAGEHIRRAGVACVIAGLAFPFAPGATAVIGLEVAH